MINPRLVSRRGITLVEVSVSTILVGLIVVGALRCLAGSTRAGMITTNSTLAMLLAEDLMEEILQQDYAEPVDSPQFGIEGAEAADVRTEWDDVDDYDNWKASPPQDADGGSIAAADWTRTVAVQQVSSDDLQDVRPDSEDTGVRKITVSVSYKGIVLSELVSVQTTAWISMIPQYGSATTTGQSPPVNQAPVAVVASHVKSGIGSLTVLFSAEGSSDPEDEPLEFEWDFGDGSTSSDQKPSHTFNNPGTETVVFPVTLVVKDIHGGRDSKTSTVTVYPSR